MLRLDLEPPDQSLIVGPTFVLGRFVSTSSGLTPRESVDAYFEFMKDRKDGEVLKAKRLVYLRRRFVRIEFGFPNTKSFAQSWYTD